MIRKFYYDDESLYAICQFEEGKKEGLQQFFYPNGILKTKECYQEGLLHGVTELYWENGQIKRQIDFDRGFRSGFDRMWNEFGVLVDEGFYRKGKPDGSHRRFNDQGGLIEEIVYWTPSKFDYRAWDQDGTLRVEGVWEDDIRYRERNWDLLSQVWKEKWGKLVGSDVVFHEEEEPKITVDKAISLKDPASEEAYRMNLGSLMERFKSLALMVPSFSYAFKEYESLPDVELGKAEGIYIYGLGNGAPYFQMQQWLHADPKRRLIFLEDDPEAFVSLLHFSENQSLISDSQVHLQLFSRKDFDYESLTKAFPLHRIEILSLASKPKSVYQSLKMNLLKKTALSFAIHLDRLHGDQPFFNFMHNVKRLPTSFYANRLKGCFENVPAMICGAGPSLTEAIPYLKDFQNRGLLIAGGSTIAALSSKGVPLHFGVAVDPNLEEYRRFKSSFAFETPILYSTRVHPKIFQTCNGPFGYMRSGIGGMLELWMDEALSLNDPFIGEDLSSDAVSVTSSAVAWAVFLGCNPIFLSGVDLAYLNRKQYAEGVGIDDEISFSSLDLEKCAADRILKGKNYHNKQVMTATRWKMERSSLSHFAKKNKHIQFFNTGAFGLSIPNIPFLSLEDAKRQYLHQEIDLQMRVQKQVAIASISKDAKGLIDSKLNDLKMSLERVVEHLSVLVGKKKGSKALSEIEIVDEEAFSLFFYDVVDILHKEGVVDAHLSTKNKWEKCLQMAEKYRSHFGRNPMFM